MTCTVFGIDEAFVSAETESAAGVVLNNIVSNGFNHRPSVRAMKPTRRAAMIVPSRTPRNCPKNTKANITMAVILMMDMVYVQMLWLMHLKKQEMI